MASYPDLKVSIAFTSDPLATSPTWVDVSAYVRISPAVQITRGGSGDPDAPDHAGRLTLTLSNRDRRFDWTHTTGPYYGYLTPKRQIKVEAVWATVTYPMFYGWVTGFPNRGTEMGKDAVCEIEAYDALGMLAGVSLGSDPLNDYYTTVASGAASKALYRYANDGWSDFFGEYPTLSTRPGAISTGPQMATSMVATSAHADGINWADTAYASFPQALYAGSWTVSCWVNSTVVPADFYLDSPCLWSGKWANVDVPGNPPLDGYSHLSVSSTGTVLFRTQYDTAGTYATGATRINDGFPHHVVVVWTSYTNIEIYVDGQRDVTTITQVGGGYYYCQFQTIGARYSTTGTIPVGTVGDSSILNNTETQDLFFVTHALTATNVATIYDLSRGWRAETTATRVGVILDEPSWPSAWRDISAATHGLCGSLNWTGQSVLSALQEVERTEQGRLFASKDGKVTFRQRYTANTDTRSNAVQVTFSDDGSNERYRSFGHARGDLDVCNDATVSNGSVQSRSTDATSKTTYGTTANTYNTVLSTYSQVRDMAAGIVFLRKDAKTRLEPIACGYPTSWADVLTLELNDRVRVEGTPMAVGSQLVADVLIDSIGWSISDEWRQTISGNPIPPDPITVGFWTLDVSQLDLGTALAY